MESALAYAFEVAPADVAAAMRWLEANAFEVVRENGGRAESFGNLALAWSDHHSKVHIMRDRGIWECALGHEAGDYQSLGLLLAVMEQRIIDMETVQWMAGAPRWPIQIPEDVSWAEVIPRSIDWLRAGDRTAEMERGNADWKTVALPNSPY